MTMRDLALIAAALLFLWGAAGLFQFLRRAIFAPLAAKKEERHD